jgi:hypothetical protein
MRKALPGKTRKEAKRNTYALVDDPDALYFSLCVTEGMETRIIITRPAKAKQFGGVNMTISEFWRMLEKHLQNQRRKHERKVLQ